MANTRTLWNNYVLKNNIGSITEKRATGLLSECGYFNTENINPELNISGTRFYDTNSQATINRVTKICQDFIKTLN